MKATTYYLFYLGLRHYLGKSVNEQYQISKRYFLRTITGENCGQCGICFKTVEWGEQTIDHIIPKSIIYEYGLLNLLFDHRNFRITHQLCNTTRGDSMDELPEPIRNKLFSLKQHVS